MVNRRVPPLPRGERHFGGGPQGSLGAARGAEA